jgi:hypothetical protein
MTAQKHVDPVDQDPEHCYKYSMCYRKRYIILIEHFFQVLSFLLKGLSELCYRHAGQVSIPVRPVPRTLQPLIREANMKRPTPGFGSGHGSGHGSGSGSRQIPGWISLNQTFSVCYLYLQLNFEGIPDFFFVKLDPDTLTAKIPDQHGENNYPGQHRVLTLHFGGWLGGDLTG